MYYVEITEDTTYYKAGYYKFDIMFAHSAKGAQIGILSERIWKEYQGDVTYIMYKKDHSPFINDIKVNIEEFAWIKLCAKELL